jgi:hypothetical protein
MRIGGVKNLWDDGAIKIRHYYCLRDLKESNGDV